MTHSALVSCCPVPQHVAAHREAAFLCSHTHICPVPPWVSCWFRSQHYPQQKGHLCFTKIKPCSGSPWCPCLSPACQLLLPLILLAPQHPDQRQSGSAMPAPAAMARMDASPHSLQALPHIPCSCLAALSLLALCISFFTTTTSSTLDLQRRAEGDGCGKSKTLCVPMHKLFCWFLLTQSDGQCCSLANNLLHLTGLGSMLHQRLACQHW